MGENSKVLFHILDLYNIPICTILQKMGGNSKVLFTF